MGPVRLIALTVAADPTAWRMAGFAVDEEGRSQVGATTLRLVGPRAGSGILAWTVDGLVIPAGEQIDGLHSEPAPPAPEEPPVHPNTALRLDHVVVTTPVLARTLAALADAGFDLRRTRDVPGRGIRQAFYRMGEVVLEVVGPPDGAAGGAAAFWGLVVVLQDLAALPEGVAEPPHDAVQPGRRIATARAQARLATHVAFMSP